MEFPVLKLSQPLKINLLIKLIAIVTSCSSRIARLCSHNDYIIVKSEYKLIQIAIPNILYIEGLKDYVKIYLEDSDKCVMSLMSLKTFEASLPQDRFMRVHRSFIVQTSKIKVIERNRIVFGKQYIPVSDSYKDIFNEYINNRTLSPKE